MIKHYTDPHYKKSDSFSVYSVYSIAA